MAKLLIKSEGFGNQVIDLKLGLNRLGRSPANDFQIEHPTISGQHCEIVLNGDALTVRDCDSTNGTFVDGEPIHESALGIGQSLQLGDVELLVESTDSPVAIPKFDMARPAPPVVLSDGGIVCPRHRHFRVSYQCTHCHEVMCEECVHRLRRRGGKVLKLCPLCSHKCEPIGGEKRKKKSFLGFLQQTVKLPFIHTTKD